MRLKPFVFILPFLAFVSMPTYAAKWQTVARQAGDRIEIDKTRIARVGDGQTLAWSRLVLDRELKVDGKPYNMVEALNRYDCASRRFSTVKRVYLQDFTPVKEESVSAWRAMNADAGTVDEELLTEVCKPRTVGEMKRVAELARQAAASASPQVSASLPDEQPPARVMLADMRQLAQADQENRENPTHLRTVADVSPEATARISLPSKADLATRAAAEKAALIPAEPVGGNAATGPAGRSHVSGAPGLNTPSAVRAVPADTHASSASMPAVSATTIPPATISNPRPYYREISRGAPRRKAMPKTVLAPVAEIPAIHWAYTGEGGPANWGKLRSDYASCATGKRQSPIDIRDGIQVDLEPIAFDYRNTLFRIIDNGHTIQAFVGDGSSITVMGRRYALMQIHFHRPSEERVNGMAFDMVAHLVHQDLDGHIAVVAVLLETGKEHPLIQHLWNNMPLEVGQELTPATPINLTALLPDADHRAYWTYMGSLTTPPCTEDVLWLVLKQTQQISAEQVAIFARLYRNNARPIQPVNNRLIKGSR